MLIVIPDDFEGAFIGNPDLERLRSRGEVRIHTTRPRSFEELVTRLKEAEVLILIRERTPLRTHLLSQLPSLRLIAMTGTGTASIDVNTATERGIIVTNTPGQSTPAVAELTMALMLSLARMLPSIDRGIRHGTWPEPMGIELSGKTLGIVGLGTIGQEVARLASAFGMGILAWGPTLTPDRAERHGATYVKLEALLSASDFVSIHLRLAERTKGLMGAKELALMKPSAYLINTARAAIVDEEALYAALRERQIAGAALDVFWEEPLPKESRWRALDNVVLTSHRGWLTQETLRRFMAAAVENVLAFLDGRPQHVVNPEALTREGL